MSILLKIIAVSVGVVMIYRVLQVMAQKKISEAQSIFWLVGAAIIIMLGLFPQIMGWLADWLGIWWPPAVLLFFIVVILSFITFGHTKDLSVLQSKVTELSMQVTLLKYENEQLRKELEKQEESCMY